MNTYKSNKLTWSAQFVLVSVFLQISSVFAETGLAVKVDTAETAMVVSGHPLATEVGKQILCAGGNAVDAAVAMAFTIGVAEPHASGLGGGGGMLIYLKKQNRVHYLDYYMQAPQNPDTTYLRDDGVATVKSICIPGTPSGLLTAHRLFGKLSRQQVMAAALDIAAKGVTVNENLYQAMLDKLEVIMAFAPTQSIFFSTEGLPLDKGAVMHNPGLQTVLSNLSEQGEAYFYRGAFAQQAVRDIRELGGTITLADFRNYKTLQKKPVNIDFDEFKIYSAPPPQSGIALLEILNIVSFVPLKTWGRFTKSVASAHFFIETLKRVDMDRRHYLGDPRFSKVPVSGILSRDYAKTRYDDIDTSHVSIPSNYDISTGNPWPFETNPAESDPSNDEGRNTTHLSVVDGEGNAVSLTQTLGLFFGSGFTSQGVLFNSSMTNFSRAGTPNELAPGKRPNSTICPSIIFENERVKAVLGTPGGTNLVTTMAGVILDLLEFGSDPVSAVNAPRINARIPRKSVLMENRFPQGITKRLEEKGHQLNLTAEYQIYMGGVQLIYLDQAMQKYIGVSDPRRAGSALGIDGPCN